MKKITVLMAKLSAQVSRREEHSSFLTGSRLIGRLLMLLCVCVCMLLLTAWEVGAASKPIWLESVEFGFPIETFSYGAAKVYAEPNLEAAIVGELTQTSFEESDVRIVQMRVLYESGPDLNFIIHDCWWRISEPIAGWVELLGLQIAHSGFIYEVFTKEDFEDPEKFLPVDAADTAEG